MVVPMRPHRCRRSDSTGSSFPIVTDRGTRRTRRATSPDRRVATRQQRSNPARSVSCTQQERSRAGHYRKRLSATTMRSTRDDGETTTAPATRPIWRRTTIEQLPHAGYRCVKSRRSCEVDELCKGAAVLFGGSRLQKFDEGFEHPDCKEHHLSSPQQHGLPPASPRVKS